MNFLTHNDADVTTSGTHLQGYISTSYSKLRGLFGESQSWDGYKTDWEWNIEFEDGTVATIYNWKNGPNYGAHEVTPDMIKEWHVGGYSQEALKNVNRILLTA